MACHKCVTKLAWDAIGLPSRRPGFMGMQWGRLLAVMRLLCDSCGIVIGCHGSFIRFPLTVEQAWKFQWSTTELQHHHGTAMGLSGDCHGAPMGLASLHGTAAMELVLLHGTSIPTTTS